MRGEVNRASSARYFLLVLDLMPSKPLLRLLLRLGLLGLCVYEYELVCWFVLKSLFIIPLRFSITPSRISLIPCPLFTQ